VKLESIIEEVLCEDRTMLEISWQSYSEFFQQTWLASHLRLVVIKPDEELSLSTQLYFALENNRYTELEISEWLTTATVKYLTGSEAKGYIEQAFSDLAEGEITDAIISSELEHLLNMPDVTWYELETGASPTRYTTPYLYGVTSFVFCRHATTFYLLELHHES